MRERGMRINQFSLVQLIRSCGQFQNRVEGESAVYYITLHEKGVVCCYCRLSLKILTCATCEAKLKGKGKGGKFCCKMGGTS